MCAGQSAGFGTSAGDQQYVNGILRVRVRIGPSNVATSSRSIDLRHLLTMSPSLEYEMHEKSPGKDIGQSGTKRKTYPCQVIHSTTS